MNDLPTNVLKRFECIGRAQERIDDLLNDEIFDNLSKHDPYWDSHHTLEEDKLREIRCKISYIHDKIASIIEVLTWEDEEI